MGEGEDWGEMSHKQKVKELPGVVRRRTQEVIAHEKLFKDKVGKIASLSNHYRRKSAVLVYPVRVLLLHQSRKSSFFTPVWFWMLLNIDSSRHITIRIITWLIAWITGPCFLAMLSKLFGVILFLYRLAGFLCWMFCPSPLCACLFESYKTIRH